MSGDRLAEIDAVEKACLVMENMGGRLAAKCPVCRGGWFEDGGEWMGAVHHADCPNHANEPPALARLDSGATEGDA